MAQIESASDQELALLVGGRVRRLRQARGWTLDELAERSTLSRRTVVYVEQGSANASIATLLQISTALGASLASIVEEPMGSNLQLRRSREHHNYWRSENGGQAQLLVSTEPPQVVELWDWKLGPGDDYRTDRHSAGTRELIHMLAGKLLVTVGAEQVELAVGDALQFRGDLKHAYANPGTKPARFSLAVFQPGVSA